MKDIISPPFCASCRILLVERTPLCCDCLQAIQPVAPLLLPITPSYSVSVIAYGAYEEPLRSLVLAKNSRYKSAAHQMSVLLAEYAATLTLSIDYVIPIPLHWRRYAARGYNQARVIAREVAARYDVPLVSLLQKTKNTKAQVACDAQERQQNVMNVFKLKTSARDYVGKHLLLVDDVVTTGATIRAAIRELKKLRPASITVLVVCRTVS